jgi:hypothetical protein
VWVRAWCESGSQTRTAVQSSATSESPEANSAPNKNGAAPAFGPAPPDFSIYPEYQIEGGKLDIFKTLYSAQNETLTQKHSTKGS